MDQIGRLNALHATTNTTGTSGVHKADSTPMFATKAADDGGFYPGLSLSKEARMEAFLTGNPMMLILNDLQGIK